MNENYYKSRFRYNKFRSIVWREISRFLSKYILKDSVIVDLGAGYCDFINNTMAKVKYAIDISSETEKYKNKDVIFLKRPAWYIPEIADSSVDFLLASNLLEHFDDREINDIIMEIKRILKPGGRLALMQPNFKFSYKNYFDDYTHKKIWTDISLKDFLISNDFDIIKVMPKFLPFSMNSLPFSLPNFLLSALVYLYIHSPIKPLAGQMLIVAQKR